MRLVLCDDHRILADALAVALRPYSHEVVAIALTPEEGVVAVAVHRPDICLLDLHFSDRVNGLETARVLRADYPDTKVVVLSGIGDPAVVSQAIELGVAGFIRKDQSVDKIAAALDLVASGGVVFDAALLRTAVRYLGQPRRNGSLHMLTTRERDVLSHFAEGRSTKQIARSMGIATSTVRTYAQNVLTKLGAHSRLEAAAILNHDGAPYGRADEEDTGT